ncbi:MAG: GyrI-like domain-containing protein [Isosphaeraceae bacterium]
MEAGVRLQRVDARPVAVVRRRASSRDLPRVVPEACGLVWNVIRSRKIPGAGRHVSIYWDDQINLDVGVELESPFDGEGEVVGSTTPAGEVVTATHLGPYDHLHETHRAILEWCSKRGRTLAGPSWEIYGHWLDEWNTNPALIRTDVYYLLKSDESDAGRSPAEDQVGNDVSV